MNLFETLFLIAVYVVPIGIFLYGCFRRKPQPPKRTIYGAGWTAPVANPTYYEEQAEYYRQMAEWNRRR